jgi:hypothetical protein
VTSTRKEADVRREENTQSSDLLCLGKMVIMCMFQTVRVTFIFVNAIQVLFK